MSNSENRQTQNNPDEGTPDMDELLRFLAQHPEPIGQNNPVPQPAADLSGGEDLLDALAVCPALGIYITSARRLTSAEEMLDNFVSNGGDLKTWWTIAVAHIPEGPTRSLVELCFRLSGTPLHVAGQLEIEATSPNFETFMTSNSVTRGIRRMLEMHAEETGHAKIKRLALITEGTAPPSLRTPHVDPLLHMMLELFRPGDAGYPEED